MKIIKESNELETRSKKHKKKHKGLSPFSYLNTDAGNVEKGIEVFNNSVTTNDTAAGEGVCESFISEDLARDFVELSPFRKALKDLNIDEEQLREIQNYILKDENISGTNIGKNIYKLRYRIPNSNKGKSGGLRIIYIDIIVSETIYLVTMYAKGEKEELTKEEYNALYILSDSLQKGGK